MIRVAGPLAWEKVDALFLNKGLTKMAPNTLHYGSLEHEGVVLDEVVIGLFKSPRSYTGDDIVEISCHGSPFILQKVMEALYANGIRQAVPGEFTQRAFLNGKMDLSMAEAVADLIASESRSAQQAALYQLKGGFSRKIKELRDSLLNFTSLMELELDFAEEDVEFADRSQFKQLLFSILKEIDRLLESFEAGSVIRQGVSVVIAGRPNAGKSTLLNALLQEEKAIVSSIPGTTRDVIEDIIHISGVVFRFIDTAGIRQTENEIERIGIDRALDKMKQAHLIIYLFDAQELSFDEVVDDLEQLPTDKPRLVVANKSDEYGSKVDLSPYEPHSNFLAISSKEEQGLSKLKDKLLERSGLLESLQDHSHITNQRHFESLKETAAAIRDVLNGMDSSVPTDLIALDVRRALHAMGEITGEITNDEILGNIFSKFCIGK